ncbi:MAG: hypothetical protein ACREP7_05650 [Lysobacter sp.]
MKFKTLKDWRAATALVVFAFAFAFGATASPLDLVVCAGGAYCEADVRQPCLAAGGQNCDVMWRMCVLDACPQ